MITLRVDCAMIENCRTIRDIFYDVIMTSEERVEV